MREGGRVVPLTHGVKSFNSDSSWDLTKDLNGKEGSGPVRAAVVLSSNIVS